MQSELNGEVRPVIRNRRGVVWCPFCDTSSVLVGGLVRCSSCFASFTDDAIEAIPSEEPRRRRRAVVTTDDTSAPEMVIEEIDGEADADSSS